MPNEYEERNIVEQQESQSIIESSQVEDIEIFIDSRRSCAQCEGMEDLYREFLQDINESSMIAVLMARYPHGYPLWVTKVI